MDFLSTLYIIIIFLVGLIIAIRASKNMGINILVLAYLEHMFLSYYYYIYALSHSADANMYYYMASHSNENWVSNFNLGTDFIIFIATFFVRTFGFTKLVLFFLFGLFGFIGFF